MTFVIIWINLHDFSTCYYTNNNWVVFYCVLMNQLLVLAPAQQERRSKYPLKKLLSQQKMTKTNAWSLLGYDSYAWGIFVTQKLKVIYWRLDINKVFNVTNFLSQFPLSMKLTFLYILIEMVRTIYSCHQNIMARTSAPTSKN